VLVETVANRIEEAKNLLKLYENKQKNTECNGYRLPYASDIAWIRCAIELLKHYDEDLVEDRQGYLIEKKYIVSPHNKWKVIGKNKWYRYKDIDDLVTRYLKKGNNYENNKSV
jgi:hypothetical protein